VFLLGFISLFFINFPRYNYFVVSQINPDADNKTNVSSSPNQGRITISSNCHNTSGMINGTPLQWNINTPNFPQRYSDLSNCHWTIFTEPGFQVPYVLSCVTALQNLMRNLSTFSLVWLFYFTVHR